MEIIVYLFLLFLIWIVLCIKDVKKDLKNHMLLFIFGVSIGFVTEVVLISFGFYHFNTAPLILNWAPSVIPIYLFFLSFLYVGYKKLKIKFKKTNYLMIIFLIGIPIFFVNDAIAINLVNYWRYTFGPEILNVAIAAPFAESMLGVVIFYFTSFFTKLK